MKRLGDAVEEKEDSFVQHRKCSAEIQDKLKDRAEEFRDFVIKLRKTVKSDEKLDSCFEMYEYLADDVIEERARKDYFTLNSMDLWREEEGMEETIMEELKRNCEEERV